MSTSYHYNSIDVAYFKTTSFTMDQEYDPSNTDAIRNHYTIVGRGFIYTDTLTFPETNTATVLAAIKAKLESPRRDFVYKIGDTIVVQVPTGLDAKLGPRPLPARVTEVNSGTFMVECGVEVWTVDCDAECVGGSVSPVISVRWTQTESFDESWYSRVHTKGLLIVRSDLRQNADNFRPLATPGLLPDYRRLSATYTLSHDGLQLEWDFEDKEEDRLPPDPANKASGTYSTEVMRPGVQRWGTATVSLEGPKGSSRRDLMVKAISMCYSKLQSDNINTKTRKPIWGGSFKEDLFVPKVTASMSAMMSPVGAKAAAAADPGGILAPGARATIVSVSVMPSVGRRTDGLRVNQPGMSPPQRKRLAGLLVAAFRDPCACVLDASLTLTSAPSPASAPPSPAIVNLTPAAVVNEGLTSAVVLSDFSDTITDFAPYDTYRIELTTSMGTGLVQLPGTGVGSDGQISKVVSASGPMMQLQTSWVAGRTGAPPVLPTFFSTDSNLVALDGAIVAQDVTPTADGGDLVYLFAGYYIHAVLDPSKFQIKPGVAPFFSQLITQGAQKGASSWSDAPVWGTEAYSGNTQSQPFVLGGVSTGGTPQLPPGYTTQVAVAFNQSGTLSPGDNSTYVSPVGQ